MIVDMQTTIGSFMVKISRCEKIRYLSLFLFSMMNVEHLQEQTKFVTGLLLNHTRMGVQYQMQS